MGFGTLKLGAVMLAVAAIIHVMLSLYLGLSEVLLAVGAVVLAALLWKNWRSAGWLALMIFIVAIGSRLGSLGTGEAPDILLWGIIVVDLIGALSVLVALWRPRAVQQTL